MEINTIITTILGYLKGLLGTIDKIFSKIGIFGDLLMIVGLVWVSWKISRRLSMNWIAFMLTLAFYLLIKFSGGA